MQKFKHADEIEWIKKEPQPLERRSFLISNKAISGKTITQIEPIRILPVSLTRLTRNGVQQAFSPDMHFSIGDVITAVGEPASLHGLEMILGESVSDHKLEEESLISSETYVTSFQMAGKSVQELQIRRTYGVTS